MFSMSSTRACWRRLFTSDRTLDELDSNIFTLFVERLFKIRERKSTIAREIKCGGLHFVSCAFILAVNPSLLEPAGFSTISVASGTAIATGVACILCGLFANLPFVLAPTTSTSIYFSLYLQNRALSPEDGKISVFFLGLLFTLCAMRPVAMFITNVIPFVIKVGVCLGVGLLIALEALIEIGLVRTGEHTVLDIGNFTIEIYIAMFAFVVIGLALHYRIRGSFLIGLAFGTIFYWVVKVFGLSSDRDSSPWPTSVFIEANDVSAGLSSLTSSKVLQDPKVYRLIFDLFIIGMILLTGLSHGLAETSGLKRDDNSLPRGKWIYMACGIGTILAAVLGCGPIMISPESAPGIKAGASTGLSTVVCGILFLISTLICPVFAATPATGTSPVLIMIGMMLFENAKLVNWSTVKEALPVFLMAIFIPFTYSIFNGVIFGFGIYLILFIFTENELFQKKLRVLKRKLRSIFSKKSDNNQNVYEKLNTDTEANYKDIDRRNIIGHSDSQNAFPQKGSRNINALSSIESDDIDNENENFFPISGGNNFLSFELNEINDGNVIHFQNESNVDSLSSYDPHLSADHNTNDEDEEYTITFDSPAKNLSLFQGMKVSENITYDKETSMPTTQHPLHRHSFDIKDSHNFNGNDMNSQTENQNSLTYDSFESLLTDNSRPTSYEQDHSDSPHVPTVPATTNANSGVSAGATRKSELIRNKLNQYR